MEFYKIAGAILMACLVVIGVSSLADIFYHVETPEAAAYPIEVAEADGHGGGGTEEVTQGPSLAALLAAADPSKGERLFKQCVSCHNATKGGPNGTGPNLWGIVGAKKAHRDDFSYSPTLAGMEGNWDFEKLDTFLENPKGYVKNTKMSFAGLKRAGDRADILIWLNQQSDAPQPLPQPEAAPAPDAAPEQPPAEATPAPAEEAAPAGEGH